MFEILRDRIQELHDYYTLRTMLDMPLIVRYDGSRKVLFKAGDRDANFTGQGGLMWLVYHTKRNGQSCKYGPMDTKELRTLHTELYWAEIPWAEVGVDIPVLP